MLNKKNNNSKLQQTRNNVDKKLQPSYKIISSGPLHFAICITIKSKLQEEEEEDEENLQTPDFALLHDVFFIVLFGLKIYG